MGRLMTESLFRLIEKEDEYAFLRECEEFQELKEKIYGIENKYRLRRSFLSCARGIIETVWKSKEGST